MALLTGLQVSGTLSVFTSSDTSTTATGVISPYSRSVLSDNPIAYYPMDEKSGTTAYDITANKRNATYTADSGGGVSLQGDSIAMNAGGSAAFAGGYVATPTLPINTAPGSFITVEFWMQLPNNQFGTPMPFSSGLNDLWFQAGQFGFNTGNADQLFMPESMLYNRPVHVVAVMGNLSGAENSTTTASAFAANRILYIDGVQQPLAQSGSPLVRSLKGDFRVSGWIGGPDYRMTAGTRVSDFAVYNGALTPTQIQNHYRAGLSYANQVLAANPLAYWKFDEPAGATKFTDFTQKGYTGTYPAGAQPGAASLTKDGGASTNWNDSGWSDINVPTLSSAPGAVTTVELWLDAPTYVAERMPLLLGDYSLWNCPSYQCGVDSFGINASYGNCMCVPWSSIGNGRHHIVVSLTNGNQSAARMWVDGTERTLTAYATMNPNPIVGRNATADWPGNVRFGGSQFSTTRYQWLYRVDEVAIYNGLLTPATITAHYNTGK